MIFVDLDLPRSLLSTRSGFIPSPSHTLTVAVGPKPCDKTGVSQSVSSRIVIPRQVSGDKRLAASCSGQCVGTIPDRGLPADLSLHEP